jgi:hypothetical protein
VEVMMGNFLAWVVCSGYGRTVLFATLWITHNF